MIELKQVDFEVAGPDGSRTTMAGHYTAPVGGTDRGVLQVLVHGGTYDHRYWNVPEVDGEDYSYARYAAERGYAVLAVDHLATGASAPLPGDAVTLEMVSDALADVVEQSRTDDGPLGRGFDRIALVGHSIGTLISIHAQARRHPADVLCVSGIVHSPGEEAPFPEGVIETAMAQEHVDLPPHARLFAFYDAATAAPAAVEMDNATLRTTIARGLLVDAFRASADNGFGRVAEVTGPVYVQLGDKDRIAPGRDAPAEPAFWTGTDDVTVDVLTGIGHVFNLHLDREASWRGFIDYLGPRLG